MLKTQKIPAALQAVLSLEATWAVSGFMRFHLICSWSKLLHFKFTGMACLLNA